MLFVAARFSTAEEGELRAKPRTPTTASIKVVMLLLLLPPFEFVELVGFHGTGFGFDSAKLYEAGSLILKISGPFKKGSLYNVFLPPDKGCNWSESLSVRRFPFHGFKELGAVKEVKEQEDERNNSEEEICGDIFLKDGPVSSFGREDVLRKKRYNWASTRTQKMCFNAPRNGGGGPARPLRRSSQKGRTLMNFNEKMEKRAYLC
ncbi:hypothetical protein PIB30_093130 [Stylosanthes scabra]|uniref:Uncharacterized protein n=1 Tax=Stylosanthes scabra TaxID=79078 RepID=A0ABU6QUE1_9FABA|nr:hypothetical protein [Stylosanthes scabra]